MEADRQRRLYVQNRLEELRRKHGSDIEKLALPEWLDHLPESARPAKSLPAPTAPRPAAITTAPAVSVSDLDV